MKTRPAHQEPSFDAIEPLTRSRADAHRCSACWSAWRCCATAAHTPMAGTRRTGHPRRVVRGPHDHGRARSSGRAAQFGGTWAREGYIHGHWRCDDSPRWWHLVVNRPIRARGSGLAARGALLRRVCPGRPKQSQRSARNIAPTTTGHDLYEMMLAERGLFVRTLRHEKQLEESSIEKVDAVCRKWA